MTIAEYKITADETKEIRSIYFKRLSIMELMESCSSNEFAYERLKNDFASATEDYQNWFRRFEESRHNRGRSDASWHVDFARRTVALVANKEV